MILLSVEVHLLRSISPLLSSVYAGPNQGNNCAVLAPYSLFGTLALGRLPLPILSMAFCRAPWRPNCEGTPSIRCVELMFLTSVIWKQVAPPWREVMVE